MDPVYYPARPVFGDIPGREHCRQQGGWIELTTDGEQMWVEVENGQD